MGLFDVPRKLTDARMAYDLIIRNGDVVTPRGVTRASIAIDDEHIVEIGPEISGAARGEIDATGLHVFPGVIDPHVHFNEPGRTEWEGISTGSAALAAGGGTCFFDMPLNSSPPVLDRESFDRKLAAAREKSFTDFALWGGLTPTNLDKLEDLANCGVIGFKAFMSNSGIDDFASADDLTLFQGMVRAAALGLPVAVHAESEALTSALALRAIAEGRTGMSDYLQSRPIVAEVGAIRRAIGFARETSCSLHVVHVSSAAGSIEVVEAKHEHVAGTDRALDVTCETCPHYLLLTDADALRLGSAGKCAPPLRDREQVDRLWFQLRGGGIDMVASDHSPSPPSMKEGDNFFKTWGGIAGVQSTLPALLSTDPPLPTELIAGLTSTNIGSRFGVRDKGSIAAGNDADLALVDVAATYVLTRDMLLDRHKMSPYLGRTFRGRVVRTLVRGTSVFRDGKIISQPIGRLVRPA